MPETKTPFDFEYTPNKRAGLCPVKGCAKRSGSSKGHKLCDKHRMEKWRKNNPAIAQWYILKDHAKVRRISFSITRAQFVEFCRVTGYLDRKGNERDSWQIDRLDATKGYSLDNIAVVTTSENVAKSNRERWLPEHVQEMIHRKRLMARGEFVHVDDDDYEPFPVDEVSSVHVDEDKLIHVDENFNVIESTRKVDASFVHVDERDYQPWDDAQGLTTHTPTDNEPF